MVSKSHKVCYKKLRYIYTQLLLRQSVYRCNQNAHRLQSSARPDFSPSALSSECNGMPSQYRYCFKTARWRDVANEKSVGLMNADCWFACLSNKWTFGKKCHGPDVVPDHHQNVIICSLAHCKLSIKNFRAILLRNFSQSC